MHTRIYGPLLLLYMAYSCPHKLYIASAKRLVQIRHKAWRFLTAFRIVLIFIPLNGAYMRAYIGHMGAAMGHICAHIWAIYRVYIGYMGAAMGQQWGMHTRIHGHIWGQQWGIRARIHGPYRSSNRACMRAYMGHIWGHTWATWEQRMGHVCAHTWATWGQQWGMHARIHGHIWGQQWGMHARIHGPYVGQPYRESREGIPYYSLPFPAPGKGITEPSFPSLPFPGSLPWPGKGRDSLPCSAA